MNNIIRTNDMVNLEGQLEKAYEQLDISPKNQGSVNAYLNLLNIKDQDTYEHSIRVGLLGIRVAKHASLDEKAMFYAGTLHDVGKILVRTELLKKPGKFSKKEMKEMEKHAEYGYKLLSGIHDFSAEIALRHHEYQQEKYPKKLKKSEVKFSEKTKSETELYANMLSVIDFYDAIKNRTNQKFKKKDLSQEEVKRIILKNKPDYRRMIEDLYSNNIFN